MQKTLKLFIAVIFCTILALNTSIYAKDSDIKYELTSAGPISIGPNKSVIKIGQSILTKMELVNKTDGTDRKEIDNTKVNVEVSNPKLVTTKANGKITAKAEGKITVKYTYKEDNITYTYEEYKTIVSDGFSTGDIPAVNTSILDLKVGESEQNIIVSKVQAGTYAIVYPEGYTKDNYYKFEWSVEDDKIAKIEKVSDKEVKVSPVSKGATKVICTITTADKKETIKKIVTVNVAEAEKSTTNETENKTENTNTTKDEQKTDNNTIDNNTINNNTNINNTNTNNNIIGNQNSSKINDNTVTKKELPKTGLFTGLLSIIIITAIAGFICYVKYKKID